MLTPSSTAYGPPGSATGGWFATTVTVVKSKSARRSSGSWIPLLLRSLSTALSVTRRPTFWTLAWVKVITGSLPVASPKAPSLFVSHSQAVMKSVGSMSNEPAPLSWQGTLAVQVYGPPASAIGGCGGTAMVITAVSVSILGGALLSVTRSRTVTFCGRVAGG